jgi:hypothetical protein
MDVSQVLKTLSEYERRTLDGIETTAVERIRRSRIG